MGLKERRASQGFQEGTFPELKAKIEETIGKEVTFEVAWDELAEDEMDHLYEEFWPKVYFEPITRALTDIASDDMGKSAVAEGLSKIVIKNSNEYANPEGISFGDKTLTIDHKPTTNVDAVDSRFEKVKTILENSL